MRIQNIIAMLQLDSFVNSTYNIHVAKGLFKYPHTIKDAYNSKRRMTILKKLDNGRKKGN
jgi:hypothetical protein